MAAIYEPATQSPTPLARAPENSNPSRQAQFASPQQLFRESEIRLGAAASSGRADEELIASRLLANAGLYCRWEVEHRALLAQVLRERRAGPRQAELVSVCVRLIHRKALFEYLRQSQLRGQERITLLYRALGQHHYSQLVVMEHGNYLRSAASYLCMAHIGTHVFRNALYAAPLREYEALYADLYHANCEAHLLDPDDPLAGYFRQSAATLKKQVLLKRSILLHCALHETRAGPAPAVERRH